MTPHRSAPSPADLYGDLLSAVQTGRVFGDGKTFVDCTALRPPAEIAADYARLRPIGDDLHRFVAANFALPHPAEVPAPQARPALRQYIADLWDELTRPGHGDDPAGSRLALPRPYLVPGGRFAELYYWDTYFSMLGLVRDGRIALAEDLLENFTSLIEQHGFVPNGTRTYYLGRSQPPLYAAMVALLPHPDPLVGQRRLNAMMREHAYWMHGAHTLAPGTATMRVVRLEDGMILNRYWDDRATPRDESFAEDVETATRAPHRPMAEVFRDLRAGAESGWDFSSRWMGVEGDLSTIRTTAIVPVDLNAFLYLLEDGIARLAARLYEPETATAFSRHARLRRSAIHRHLWSPEQGCFTDYDHEAGRRCDGLTAATLVPLFAGLATRSQAQAVAQRTADALLALGGLRTTLTTSGEQWDAPNGWAPLQWMGFEGLWRYGHRALALEIADRWCAMVDAAFRADGWLHEKYDVEAARCGKGGEYVPQHGFGWTNGVTAAFLDILDQHRSAPVQVGVSPAMSLATQGL